MNKTQLHGRGWTPALIAQLLVKPDKTPPNPKNSHQHIKLYDEARVLAAEALPQFATNLANKAPKAAPPSAQAVVDLLEQLPNPSSAMWKTYENVMRAIHGCIHTLTLSGRLQAGDAESIFAGFRNWAERWVGKRKPTDETALLRQWQRNLNFNGWRSLNKIAFDLGGI